MSFAIIFKASTGKLVHKPCETYTEAVELQQRLVNAGVSADLIAL